MKTSCLIIAASMASVSGFAPAPTTRQTSSLNESLFRKIANMDLFEPNKTQNDYGARGKKNLSTGKLTEKSYIPSGLTKAQYEKVRGATTQKRNANYAKNVKKAGIFENYTDFYLKRGTSEGGSFLNMPNLGHRMVKTKWDWSGDTPEDTPGYTGVGALKGKGKAKAKAKGKFGKK